MPEVTVHRLEDVVDDLCVVLAGRIIRSNDLPTKVALAESIIQLRLARDGVLVVTGEKAKRQ